MNSVDYLKQRVEDQIQWYSRKSSVAQYKYKSLRVLEVVCAASIPFISGFLSDYNFELKFIIGFLGALVAILAAIQGIFRWDEEWVEYRRVCESLKKEKFLFLTHSSIYSEGESIDFEDFVRRIESIISEENKLWFQSQKRSQFTENS